MKTSLLVLALLSVAATAFADTASLVVLRASSTLGGYSPFGSVAIAKDGVLYGTFENGGVNSGGTIFAMTATGGQFTIWHNFLSATGSTPIGGPILASDGRLYGITSNGGIANAGSIYRIDLLSATYTDLHDFTAATDGRDSYGRLVEGSDGKLYGATSAGGANDAGTLFRINKDGSGFIVVHTFASATDGQEPIGAPIFGRDGRLYGACYHGGANAAGTIYAVRTDGTGFTVLRTLTKATDGDSLNGELVEGPDGFLYGTATNGGAGGNGTIFRIARNGTAFQVLKAFDLTDPASGLNPETGLTVGADGKLYGTTKSGGTGGNNGGVLFSIQTNGAYRKLAEFTAATGHDPAVGSLTQIAPLVFVGSASLDGPGAEAGANSMGTIFKFTAAVADPKVISKKKRLVTTKAKVRIAGTASSAAGIAKVEYRISSHKPKAAKGTTRWSFDAARLKPGQNTITVTAYDSRGNASKPVKIHVTRMP